MKLSSKLTIKQFDHHYWYADELKTFAKLIAIDNASILRKDELELLIKQYLKTGRIGSVNRMNSNRKGQKDWEKGLKLSLEIIYYTNNAATKEFIKKHAKKINPQFKCKLGAMYRLNRWREQEIAAGNKITYRDLVIEYIRLNSLDEPFQKVPHGRYINFLADFLKNEKDATRARAIEEWHLLKKMDIPKDYASWKKNIK